MTIPGCPPLIRTLLFPCRRASAESDHAGGVVGRQHDRVDGSGCQHENLDHLRLPLKRRGSWAGSAYLPTFIKKSSLLVKCVVNPKSSAAPSQSRKFTFYTILLLSFSSLCYLFVIVLVWDEAAGFLSHQSPMICDSQSDCMWRDVSLE